MAGSLLEKLYADFLIQDVDEAGNPAYYGFANRSGAWYIMQNTGDTTFRLATRQSVSDAYRDYAAAWAARASLTYEYIYDVNI